MVRVRCDKRGMYARHVGTNPLAFSLDIGISALHALQVPNLLGDRGGAVGSCTHNKGNHHGSGTRDAALTAMTKMRAGEVSEKETDWTITPSPRAFAASAKAIPAWKPSLTRSFWPWDH